MQTIMLTDDNFDNEVLNAKGKVVVDFWATWCGPCKMMGQVIDSLSNEIGDTKICKVNVDEQPVLAEKYNVMSIPTILLFEDGKQINKAIGAMTKESFVEFVGIC